MSNSQEEQLLYQANLLQHISDAIIATDLNFTITSWNSAAEALYGWRANEVIGRPSNQILQTQYPESQPEQVRQQFWKQGGWKGEAIQKRKDGSTVHVQASASVIKDSSGKPVGLVSVNRDISERKQAEEQFQLVVEASPSAMLLVNPEGWIHLVNKRTEALFGYTRAELLAQPVEMLVPLHLRAQHEGYRDTFFATPTARPMGAGRDLFGVRKDGSLVPVEIGLNPISTSAGRFILASIIDITERKQAEEALRLSEERFAKAFRASPDGIVISRVSDGKIIEVNDRWCSLFDYRRAEVIGHTPLELNTYANPADRQLFLSHLETRGFVRDLELTLRRKSGEVCQTSVSSEMLVIAGEPCILSLTRDITERKRTEAKLQETMAELTRSNTELEQFAYIASHDLQEPLRMVASYTQLLARRYRGKLDADADEFITFAVDGANRMKQLLNDLLAYSRVGMRGKALQPTSSEVVLEQVLANLQLAIVENQATVSHDALPTVLADQTQLLQLFQNLIGNALKFRAEQPPEIRISAEARGHEWLFSIRDNGIGLDPQFAERIFVIFQRLHNQTEYPGTGIGLAICKRIVERHGGRIWVESQPGQGATFYFTLPRVNSSE